MAKRQFEEFELGDVLGVGTVGTVYRATEVATGDVVAVKVLLPTLSQDPNISSRFEREMLILSKLDHPNIVGYYGGGEHDGQLFYVMETVEGGTMKQLLRTHGKLTWEETIRYGIPICSALQHAHNHGIVHRDLKPANLFMTYEGDVKLGDFGIALDQGEADLTNAGMTVGSFLYMAPEQIRGEEIISSHCDLYSLGCLLYEMVCGSPPFQGMNFAAVFDQHLNGTPLPIDQFAPECPVLLGEAITQLLAKSPHDRPFNARAIQGVMSELKYNWTEDELRFKQEAERLKIAFDADEYFVHQPASEISWKTIGLIFAVIAALIAITTLSN
tara:strand:- start:37955 stop:38941 length:987 start_codon:yes stop_codon:yes gene_type:complete